MVTRGTAFCTTVQIASASRVVFKLCRRGWDPKSILWEGFLYKWALYVAWTDRALSEVSLMRRKVWRWESRRLGRIGQNCVSLEPVILFSESSWMFLYPRTRLYTEYLCCFIITMNNFQGDPNISVTKSLLGTTAVGPNTWWAWYAWWEPGGGSGGGWRGWRGWRHRWRRDSKSEGCYNRPGSHSASMDHTANVASGSCRTTYLWRCLDEWSSRCGHICKWRGWWTWWCSYGPRNRGCLRSAYFPPRWQFAWPEAPVLGWRRPYPTYQPGMTPSNQWSFFQNWIILFLDTLNQKIYFLIIKINIFWGDLSDISAKTATLLPIRAADLCVLGNSGSRAFLCCSFAPSLCHDHYCDASACGENLRMGVSGYMPDPNSSKLCDPFCLHINVDNLYADLLFRLKAAWRPAHLNDAGQVI